MRAVSRVACAVRGAFATRQRYVGVTADKGARADRFVDMRPQGP
jgi:hypothetical protein